MIDRTEHCKLMPILIKMLKAGTLLSGGSAAVFTPAAGESFIINNIRFYNNHTSTVTVSAINVGSGTTKPRINPAVISLSAGIGAVFDQEITLDGTNQIDIVATGLPASSPGLNYLLNGVQKIS